MVGDTAPKPPPLAADFSASIGDCTCGVDDEVVGESRTSDAPKQFAYLSR